MYPTTKFKTLLRTILRINPDDPDSVQLTEAIQPMWAKSTWNNRTRLWKNVNEFCRVKHREMNSATAILYLQTLRVAPSTRLNYARALHTVFTLMGMECNPLKLFTNAIQAQGGTEPQRQMQPITPPIVAKIVHTPVDNTSNDGPAMLESRVTNNQPTNHHWDNKLICPS